MVEAEAEVVVPVEEPVKATPTPKKKGRPRKIRPEETPEAEKTPEAADGAEQQGEAMAAPETPVTPSRRGRKRKASAGAEEVSPEKKVTIVRTPEATFTKRRRRGMTSKTKFIFYGCLHDNLKISLASYIDCSFAICGDGLWSPFPMVEHKKQ